MSYWEVLSSRNGILYSNKYTSGSSIPDKEIIISDFSANVMEDLVTNNYDMYNTSMSEKFDAATTMGYFDTNLDTASSKARMGTALNALTKLENSLSNKVLNSGAIGVDEQGNLKSPSDAIQSYFTLQASDEPSPTEAFRGATQPTGQLFQRDQLPSFDPTNFPQHTYIPSGVTGTGTGQTGVDYATGNVAPPFGPTKMWEELDHEMKKTGRLFPYTETASGVWKFFTEEGQSAYDNWVKQQGADAINEETAADATIKPPFIPPVAPPQPGLAPSPKADFYQRLPWASIYQDYVAEQGVANPEAYQYMMEQGVAGAPELRKAQTQFMIQSQFHPVSDDPLFHGLRTGQEAASLRDEPGYRHYLSDSNPYREFLENYDPISGKDLIRRIDLITDTIKAFDEHKRQVIDPNTGLVKDLPYDGDLTNTQVFEKQGGKRYLGDDIDKRAWSATFATGDMASQHQRQLVALPILQNTNSVYRGEIVNVLNSLYNEWETNPNRPPDQSWLEFARNKNYWGLVPDEQLKTGRYGTESYLTDVN